MATYTDNLNLIKPAQGENYNVDVANTNNEVIDNAIGNKQDKVKGKGLSSCDFTLEYKRKIDGLQKIYKYKGSVDTYNELNNITDNNIGDVWNVITESKDYCWDGTAWIELGTNIDLSEYPTKTEVKENKYSVLTEVEISENTNYTIPCLYKVGEDVLDVYYMGEKLIKDIHYKEVGENGTVSNKIQFFDWGQNIPVERTIEFVVRGVYQE